MIVSLPIGRDFHQGPIGAVLEGCGLRGSGERRDVEEEWILTAKPSDYDFDYAERHYDNDGECHVNDDDDDDECRYDNDGECHVDDDDDDDECRDDNDGECHVYYDDDDECHDDCYNDGDYCLDCHDDEVWYIGNSNGNKC